MFDSGTAIASAVSYTGKLFVLMMLSGLRIAVLHMDEEFSFLKKLLLRRWESGWRKFGYITAE